MSSMRLGFRLLLVSALGLVACGETSRESACSVFDNGDGTRTIVCGEESLVVPGHGDGTTCVKSPASDGGAVIACTDGTTVFLDADGNVIHRGAGAVVGRVTLYGETGDHSGTTVRAVGTERVAVTDEKGDFYLQGLDAGVYDLLFERDGWEPLRHRNTIAVGGILYLEPLLLRRGRLLGGQDAEVRVSPANDTVLVRDERSLWLHRVDRLDPRELSPHVPLEALPAGAQAPAYDPEGKAVVFLENVDPASRSGRLRRHDVATGETVTLAERAMLGIPLAGGPVLVWRVPAGAQPPAGHGELILRYPDGVELALGSAVPVDRAAVSIAPAGVAVLARVPGLVVVDVAARQLFAPEHGGRLAAWSPDGKQAVLATSVPADQLWSATLHLLDLQTRTTVEFATGAFHPADVPGSDAVTFSPDGGRVLFLGSFGGVGSEGEYLGRLEVVDTGTFARLPVPDLDDAVVGWRFSPEGAAVIYRRQAQTLVRWNLAGNRTTALGTVALDDVRWSPGGDRFAFTKDELCTLGRIDGSGDPLLSSLAKCQQIHFLPDGERTSVVVWNDDALREVRIWDGHETGPALAVLPGGADGPGIEFAPDGSAVLWREPGDGGMESLRVLGLVDGVAAGLPQGSGYWGTFSPDGGHVVARTSALGELWVLERASGQAFRIDGPVQAGPVCHPGFVLYRIDDEEGWRGGPWLSRYPRAPAE